MWRARRDYWRTGGGRVNGEVEAVQGMKGSGVRGREEEYRAMY